MRRRMVASGRASSLLLPLLVAVLSGLVTASPDADADNVADESQTEFLLPYSETEDVDFSIAKPGGSGCYQWLVIVQEL